MSTQADMNTDTDWEKWGQQDPYFAVVTHERFRQHNLTEEAKAEFFQSGRDDVSRVLRICKRHLDHDFRPRKALDFGCGVGRLTIPLAEIADEVVGLDVSESMLAEAAQNCQTHAVTNVNLLKSDDSLSRLEGRFDFILSIIVLQHIPVKRGKRIFAALLNHLAEGGIGAVEFSYAKTIFPDSYGVDPQIFRDKGQEPPRTQPTWRLPRVRRTLKRWIGIPVPDESPSQDPEIQMNPYNINQLLFILQSHGIEKIHLELRDYGEDLAVCLYFQKPGPL